QDTPFKPKRRISHKTLGIAGNQQETISCSNLNPSMTSYTKRDVLSVIARLYDPLGLLGLSSQSKNLSTKIMA
ncbi:hypothetical protein TNIN_485711, partial [Trichonephila inaurata madagascariensis]